MHEATAFSRYEDRDDCETSPQSTVVVSTGASKRFEYLNRNGTDVPDSSLLSGADFTYSIERLHKLSRDATTIQKEQLELIDSIAGTTNQLLENRRHCRTQYAALEEENDRSHEANQTLREQCDGLTSNCEKLEAKLRKFKQPRLDLMMMDGSDEEEDH